MTIDPLWTTVPSLGRTFIATRVTNMLLELFQETTGTENATMGAPGWITLSVALLGFATTLFKWLTERRNRQHAESEAKAERTLASRKSEKIVQQKDRILELETKVETLIVKSDESAKALRAILEPPPIAPNERRISVLTIGLGGSGKTTLIGAAFGDTNASPRKTREFSVYNSTILPVLSQGQAGKASEPSRTIRSYITDYRGQNLGSLISGVLAEQKVAHSPLAYGAVRALVLVVDVVAPPASDGEGPLKDREVDQARVALHNQQWNETALEAVFGLLTRSLAYVCLWINKTDALRSDLKNDDVLKKLFEPIEKRLCNLAQDNNFRLEVLVGSAFNGGGTRQFRSAMIEHAEEPAA